MKKGWKVVKFGDVCDFIRGPFGGSLKKDSFKESGYAVYEQQNAIYNKFIFRYYIDEDKYRSMLRFKVAPGDLIMSCSGTIGKVAIIPQDAKEGIINQALLKLTPSKHLDVYYLKYLMESAYFKEIINANIEGVAIKNIASVATLKRIELIIPPLSEQKEIVEYLDSSFAKIDKLKENAAKNLEEAKALFQSALKDALEPKEGWEEKTLKEIGITQTGTTPSKSDSANYGNYMEFIRPSEIDFNGMGGINYNCELKLSEQGASNGRVFEEKSILMVCIGATIGKVGFSNKKISCNQQINVLTPSSEYDYKFVYYSMKSPRFQKMVIKEGTSSQATLPIINKGKWEKLTVQVPSLPEQQSIVFLLDSLNEKVNTLQQNYSRICDECDALKQAILRQVFE